jgi:transposase
MESAVALVIVYSVAIHYKANQCSFGSFRTMVFHVRGYSWYGQITNFFQRTERFFERFSFPGRTAPRTQQPKKATDNMNALATNTRFRRAVALSAIPRPGTRAPGSDSLTQAIRAALDSVDPDALHPVAPGDAVAALQPKALLASIVYCYVRQIYGSKEIETTLAGHLDSQACSLATRPDAHMIQEFRRKNRQAIQLCLMTVLCLLGQQKVMDGTVTKVSDTQLEEEASRRIIMAMFTDSMELGAG